MLDWSMSVLFDVLRQNSLSLNNESWKYRSVNKSPSNRVCWALAMTYSWKLFLTCILVLVVCSSHNGIAAHTLREGLAQVGRQHASITYLFNALFIYPTRDLKPQNIFLIRGDIVKVGELLVAVVSLLVLGVLQQGIALCLHVIFPLSLP